MVDKLFNSNLKLRVLSSLVLIPTTLLCIAVGGLTFNAMIIFFAILGAFEWQRMSHTPTSIRWMLLGAAYIMSMTLSLLWLRDSPFFGYAGTLWLLIVIWASDSSAFFAGRIIGGKKFFPQISPNKTWAGFYGAIIGGTLASYCVFFYFGDNMTPKYLIISMITATLSQCGDLLESAIKRKQKVKDTGSIMPGHGGVLDRIDGIFLSSLFIVALILLDLW